MSTDQAISPADALDAAVKAHHEAATATFERDGKVDCGSCGNFMLLFDARSRLTKLAIERGLASTGDEPYLQLSMPDGIRTQNADVYQNAGRAFRNSLIANGYEKAIRKFWTYID